ncbi:MAG: hypothetical protein AAFR44_01420 [Pseudomonadota bacterium]
MNTLIKTIATDACLVAAGLASVSGTFQFNAAGFEGQQVIVDWVQD